MIPCAVLDLITEGAYGCVVAYFVFLCPVYRKHVMSHNRVKHVMSHNRVRHVMSHNRVKNHVLILAVYVTFQIMDFKMLI